MGQYRRFKVEFDNRNNPVLIEAHNRRAAVVLAYEMLRGTTGAENMTAIVVTPRELERDLYTVSHTPLGGHATYVEALVTLAIGSDQS